MTTISEHSFGQYEPEERAESFDHLFDGLSSETYVDDELSDVYHFAVHNDNAR